MTQEELFAPLPRHKLSSLSQVELLEYIDLQHKLNSLILKDNSRLRNLHAETKQKKLLVEEQLITLRNKLFGKSSEKPPSSEDRRKNSQKKNKNTRVQLPSLRYPELQLIEREVTLDEVPACRCCGDQMKDSGMTENSEFLTSIPAQHVVIRQKRHKYRCGTCHGDIVTAPAPPKIRQGSAYSDEMITNVAMSKYCDLIPVDRYVKIAEREGVKGLPANSLIEGTHYLADYVAGAYSKLEEEVKSSKVLSADETTHRMLEDNNNKSSWYLWGFSTPESSFFEIHDTRSGDVASKILKDSKCEFLVSDAFSGYIKAVKDTNKLRVGTEQVKVRNIFCNAHSRRKFKESEDNYPEESRFFIEQYERIYRLEKIGRKYPAKRLRLRAYMVPIFEQMKIEAMSLVGGYSSKSKMGKALKYLLKYFSELVFFTGNISLPIDNNSQERQMRSPVIGRKTWYGNHSQRGAKTSAILFSLVESCKLNKINPREYFRNLVEDLHQGKEAYSPKEFKHLDKK